MIIIILVISLQYKAINEVLKIKIIKTIRPGREVSNVGESIMSSASSQRALLQLAVFVLIFFDNENKT